MTKFAFKKKLLSSAVAVTMISGLAISNSANAIHLSEDGIGQVLLAPYYTVQEGKRTKFAIVNTSQDSAVKAKVVFRSKGQSTEVLDFLCYMTPADVCRFEVGAEDGQAYLYSSDDSIKNGDNFASQVPVRIKLFDERMVARDAYDINEVGHVEVIGVYSVKGQIREANGTLVPIAPGMSKYHFVSIFTSPRPVADGVLHGAYTMHSADGSAPRLTGTVDIVKQDGDAISDRMAYRIPALHGWIGDNVAGMNPRWVGDKVVRVPFDGRVIACSVYDTSVVAVSESAIGLGFARDCQDNTLEIESALAVDGLKGVYEDTVNKGNGVEGTSLIVTFPTKYRHRVTNVCSGTPPTADQVKSASYMPPFKDNGTSKIVLRMYDNSENSVVERTDWSGGTIPETVLYGEVNVHTPNWRYDSGAYHLTFDPVPGCDYSGVPALGMTYKWLRSGDQTTNSVLIPSAHW